MDAKNLLDSKICFIFPIKVAKIPLPFEMAIFDNNEEAEKYRATIADMQNYRVGRIHDLISYAYSCGKQTAKRK